ncbi:MAG: UDP-4-amino-4,6-dideoxy-N-acetyl-beta-L-altrosamine transaminase [Candidatus Hodarchaeota archaeon]
MASKFIPYGLHWIDEGDVEEVIEVLKGNWITSGSKIDEFENTLCKYIGCKYAVAVSSGTAALDIAVQALDLPRGSEVITTPFTFAATSNAILFNGLKPVFTDIQKETRNINPDEIEKKLGNKTKAIIYVDYAGHPCDISKIREIADEHNLYLVEDACHALGAEYNRKKIGNSADTTVFSFHPVKHITTGEGGVITTNNEEFYDKLKMLRNHGIDKSALERFGPKAGWAYDLKYLGRNYRITDFQVALGLSQLKKLDLFIRRRSEIAKRYNEILGDIPEFEVPVVRPNVKHVWHIYTTLLNNLDRDAFFSKMREKNIGVNVHYIPIYRFSYYRKHFSFSPENFPVTEQVFNRIITLPLFPKMNEEQIREVIDAIKKSIEELK